VLKEQREPAQEMLPAAADEQSDLIRVQEAMLVHRLNDFDVALGQFDCRGIPRALESRAALYSVWHERRLLRKSAHRVSVFA
jgi:hypothetical protein